MSMSHLIFYCRGKQSTAKHDVGGILSVLSDEVMIYHILDYQTDIKNFIELEFNL